MSHSPCVPSHLKNGLNSECEYHHYFSDYHNHSKRPQLCTAKHNCGTHANLTGQAGKIFARIIKLWSGVCIARKWINFQLEVSRGCWVTVVQTGWSLVSGLEHSVCSPLSHSPRHCSQRAAVSLNWHLKLSATDFEKYFLSFSARNVKTNILF